MLRRLARTPALGRIILIPFRLVRATPDVVRPARNLVRWIFASRELTNYTYDLTELNVKHLAAFVAEVTGTTRSEVMVHIAELEGSDELKEHIRSTTQQSDRGRFADLTPRYARRLGWYAIIRAVKPRIVVETGVDKGLGACVVAEALRRNAAEGNEGYYYGTDIKPEAGYLLVGPYARFGEVVYGDSIKSLGQLEEGIDVFISDSDHSPDYEMAEYETISHRLTDGALILSDNAHRTDQLLHFADRTGRRFLFFHEEPKNHWYPGAGIGVAFGSIPRARSSEKVI